ncbi:MAG: hypothetical protein WAO15_23980 [Mycobacterium sp.]
MADDPELGFSPHLHPQWKTGHRKPHVNTDFKWPDDADAPPREKVPVEATMTPNT